MASRSWMVGQVISRVLADQANMLLKSYAAHSLQIGDFDRVRNLRNTIEDLGEIDLSLAGIESGFSAGSSQF